MNRNEERETMPPSESIEPIESTDRTYPTLRAWTVLVPILSILLLAAAAPAAAQDAPPTRMETEAEMEPPMELGTEGAPAEMTERDEPSVAEEVMAADSALATALDTGDREAFAALVAEDALFLSGQGALRGRDAVVAGWGPLMAEDRTASLTWEPAGARVAVSLDLAYTVGDYVLTLERGEGQEPLEDRGRYISVWRRPEGGAWQVIADGPLRRDRAAYLEVELERQGLIGPEAGAVLAFQPERRVVAGSGDLSFTAGSYRAARLDADGVEEPVATGAWFAVWATDPETGDSRLLPAGDSVTPPPPPAPEPVEEGADQEMPEEG